ncbi:MAG: hypothetical protein PHI97_24975 [Desulfobulbus sp.]|nr:hypothetical protein [Desulfobulbus sp.]
MKPRNSIDPPVLPEFRKVAKSYSKSFMETKNHVFDLLGRQQNAESGRFREELLRSFLSKLLPTSVSVDTGFIYGFEQVETSKQLDIIIWHRAVHSPVYDAGQFVIVPPESVIAVISVKSKMTSKELDHGLDNLLSVVPLDLKFRRFIYPKTGKPMPPIMKFLVFYSQPDSIKAILPRIQNFYANALQLRSDFTASIIPSLQRINPFDVDLEIWDDLRRIYPCLITTIENGGANFFQGWGPPDDIYGQGVYGPGLRRLPYMYRQSTNITTGLEKFMYYLLESIYRVLESPGLSLLSAWGDLNPATGTRGGDPFETLESEGVPLLDCDKLPQINSIEGQPDS